MHGFGSLPRCASGVLDCFASNGADTETESVWKTTRDASGARPGSAAWLLPTSHWPTSHPTELGHMASRCKGGWEIQSSLVPRGRGRVSVCHPCGGPCEDAAYTACKRSQDSKLSIAFLWSSISPAPHPLSPLPLPPPHIHVSLIPLVSSYRAYVKINLYFLPSIFLRRGETSILPDIW